MTLASLLVGRGEKKDEELDDIFKSNAVITKPSTSSAVAAPKGSKKRKRDQNETPKTHVDKRNASVKGERRQRQTQSPIRKLEPEEEEPSESEAAEEQASIQVSENEETDENDELPVHESLKTSVRKKGTRSKKVKYVPDGETKEMRDARTIFIGNLPVEIITSKPLAKQLKKHILSYVSSVAAIESVRFRSVAFNNPTTPLSEDSKTDNGPQSRQQRQQKRAAEWRDHKKSKDDLEANKEEAEIRKGEKEYLTPAQKRRLAAIKGDVHSHAAATTNAYVVFAHPIPHASDSKVPRKEVMDPYEAAREVSLRCDGTLFAEHTIRVDLVGKTNDSKILSQTDPKLSIFVGNLDFATTDDDIRSFFEGLLVDELGKPGVGNKRQETPEEDEEMNEENSDTPKQPTWVSRVRVVRDRDTQLGKGIAYVQFSDRNCVDEVLALDSAKLKFAKRPLRVQRCKANAAVSAKAKAQASQQSQSSQKQSASHSSHIRKQSTITPPPIPKGDPNLGERLAGLTKDKRKVAKASDPSRVARRLAKKKARAVLAKAGVKESGTKRIRERKEKKDVVNTGRKEGKRRVRSDRNVEKRNVKK